MSFDLENAVLHGWARDVDTNDWHIDAHDVEVVLSDRSGGTTFTIRDVDNVGVAEIDSDGYLSILGNAEVHGGHVLIEGETLTNTEFITLQDLSDEVSIYLFDLNPDGGISGEQGSFGTNYNDGYMYVNVDGAFKWERLAMVSQIPALSPSATTTLQQAYDNDADGGDATITTDATDGAVVIAGTEKFQVTATGGIDLDTGFDMDATSNNFDVSITSGSFSFDVDQASNLTVDSANLTLETTTSGNVQVNVPDGGGDFIVDDAGGSRYIRAITSNGELQLGDPTTPVFVTIMNDMEVLGDMVVQGTTTSINTQQLWVEDRLVRLNTGSPSNFNDNVGIEAEVGSDGYVEFHWDDSQSRWEISIDRSVVPESQTFRPLPYLASNAATLDLSATGNDGWPTDGPNPTAGASVVNTNLTNFPYTFGPSMTDDSVQAALEAIDGYFISITEQIGDAELVTLQQAYKNDPDAGGATITTDPTDGPLVIAGTQSFWVTTAGGINLDTGFDMDTNGDSFDVHVTGATVSIDGYNQPGNFSIDSADLVVETTTSGDLWLNSADDIHATATNTLDLNATTIDADATDVNIDATNAISLDAAAASNFSVADAGLTLETTGGTGGAVTINAAGAAAGDVDINAANDVLIDATGMVSIEGAEASDFTTSSGAITIDGAGGIVLEGNTNNVTPGTSCTDSLGDSTHGWTDIYLCNGSTPVALSASGGSSAPNTTSGASVVGINASNFDTFGPDMTDNTVQAALEAIDGYIQDLSIDDLVDTTYTKTLGLDINGAVLNGVVKVSTDAGTPALDFKKNQTSRASWSMPVPSDWDGVSDIDIEVIWSPATAGVGNVEWRLEYKSLALTELASSATTNVDYTQAAGGTADALQSTTTNLVIPAGNVAASDAMIIVNIVRRGSAGSDTYGDYAQVHLIKYSYSAQNIV